MVGIIEAGSAIMRSSEQRLEIVGQNIANTNTPGYKSILDFQKLLLDRAATADSHSVEIIPDFPDEARLAFPLLMPQMQQGALVKTGAPLDMAISGDGFFQLRSDDALVYSRNGQFLRMEDGRIATADGLVLQQAGGGDLMLDSSDVEIASNGLVLARGLPVARIPLFVPDKAEDTKLLSGSLFVPAQGDMREMDDVMIRQGMTEASNVALDKEMVRMMEASRFAQTGARLVQLYDQLMGRAVTTLGQ